MAKKKRRKPKQKPCVCWLKNGPQPRDVTLGAEHDYENQYTVMTQHGDGPPGCSEHKCLTCDRKITCWICYAPPVTG